MRARHVRTIARVEVRRRWRALRDNELQLLALALGVMFMGMFSLGGLFIAGLAGSMVRSGEVEAPVVAARNVAVFAWLFATGMSGYLVFVRGLEPDHLDGLLTTVSHREVIAGLLGAELLVWAAPTLLYGALLSIAFAVGARTPVPVPFVLASLALLVVLGHLAGFILALSIKNLGVRSRLLARLRTVVFVLLGLAYFWALTTQAIGDVVAPIHRAMVGTPLAWYGDLALLGTHPDASLPRALGSVLLAGVAVVLGLGVLGRLAGWYWYVDPVRVGGAEAARRSSRFLRLVTGRFPRPMRGVIRTDWRRARRAPITLSFVLYPLIVLLNPVRASIEAGAVTGSLPLWVGLVGVWITGSLFTLNVIGNEGAVLPATVLGVNSGSTFVRGHVVAGWLVGAPATLLLVVGLGLASPLPAATVATLALATLVLVGTAAPIATGIGATFPRFDAVNVSRSREAVVPSFVAFAIYSGVILVIAAPALLAHVGVVVGSIHDHLGIAPVAVALVGTAVSGTLGLVVARRSMARAATVVETFTMDG